MRDVQRSNKTKCNALATNISNLIKGVFNRDVFGTYDGIIEKVDFTNKTLNVRIPELGNSLYEDCKFILPCSTSSSIIFPNFKINTPVVITFKQFNLGKPVVIGFRLDDSLETPIENNAINIINENNKIVINDESIIITNGISSIILDTDGIRLIAPANKITANGEDLTVDDEGAI
ncbi:MAG: hypothetical protein WCR19_05695 [Acholeplasmataceae bacterium]